MTSLEVFLWASSGSLGVDVIAFAKHYQSERKRKLPHYYYSVGYYVLRLVIAGMAGGFALAYGIQQALLAINIGASAPMLIVAASNGLAGSASRITKD
jgi:hypothetical protein